MDNEPSVGSADWKVIGEGKTWIISIDEKNNSFFKSEGLGYVTKYFYGESAWGDVQRYTSDKSGDSQAWCLN